MTRGRNPKRSDQVNRKTHSSEVCDPRAIYRLFRESARRMKSPAVIILLIWLLVFPYALLEVASD